MSTGLDLKLLRIRRTKIVATLGPASDSEASVRALVDAGVDVFRLNLSHGDHASHAATFERVRCAAAAARRHVGILADLAGPKIRTGAFPAGPIELETGARVTVTTRVVAGRPGLVPSQYRDLARDVTPGSRILLADGTLELEVEAIEDDTEVRCVVRHGGRLSDHKGINLPGGEVSAPALSEKDRGDARFLAELGVDFLGLSFVRRAEDVHDLREVLAAAGSGAAVVAKIERPEALANARAIVAAADAVMVARGDLGVELPPEQVPIAQLHLIDLARQANRPVIIATQMLESMVHEVRPTRAEVSDVSGSVLSGADAVMLSGETASGDHPLAAVRMMDRIVRLSEAWLWEHHAFGSLALDEPPISAVRGPEGDGREIAFGGSLARSVGRLSRELGARAVIVVSHGGMSAVTMSAGRPAAPVIGISEHPETCRRMALMWGLIPYAVASREIADPIALARAVAPELELARPGDYVLLVQGFHTDPRRNTPGVTVVQV
jgi:pyruvate kinase